MLAVGADKSLALVFPGIVDNVTYMSIIPCITGRDAACYLETSVPGSWHRARSRWLCPCQCIFHIVAGDLSTGLNMTESSLVLKKSLNWEVALYPSQKKQVAVQHKKICIPKSIHFNHLKTCAINSDKHTGGNVSIFHGYTLNLSYWSHD